MSFPNSRYPVRLARPADSEAISHVLESGSYPGNIEVRFTRKPDVLASFARDGDALVMPVAEDAVTGEIIGTGCCILRRAYIGGNMVKTGYLTGLKLLEQYRRRADCIRSAYTLIARETVGSCSFYASTILSDNTTALQLLEKPREGIPRYRFLGEYKVFCLSTGKKARLPAGLHLTRGGGGIAAFYRKHLNRYDLAPVWGSLYGLNEDNFHTLRDGSGEILAACAIWNQQGYKQYTVTRYGGLYRYLRCLPIELLGYPSLPRAGMPVNYASLAMALIRPDSLALGEAFIDLVAAEAKEYDFVMFGAHESHPLHAAAGKLRHIGYSSRLYSIEFPGVLSLDGRPIMLEVGLL